MKIGEECRKISLDSLERKSVVKEVFNEAEAIRRSFYMPPTKAVVKPKAERNGKVFWLMKNGIRCIES